MDWRTKEALAAWNARDRSGFNPATATQAERRLWFEAGKPACQRRTEQSPSVPESSEWWVRLIDDCVREHGDMLSEAIGAEVGGITKGIEEDFNAKLEAARAELRSEFSADIVRIDGEIAELRRRIEQLAADIEFERGIRTGHIKTMRGAGDAA